MIEFNEIKKFHFYGIYRKNKNDQFLKIYGCKYDELPYFMFTVCEQYSLNIMEIDKKNLIKGKPTQFFKFWHKSFQFFD